MVNYPVGDYLIQIKNAAKAGRKEVVVKNSKFIKSVADALVRIRIIDAVEIKEDFLVSRLSYHKKEPVLVDLKLISKPGIRRYMNVEELSLRKRRNASKLIVSTPLGVMSSAEALKKNVGGEIIAEVW